MSGRATRAVAGLAAVALLVAGGAGCAAKKKKKDRDFGLLSAPAMYKRGMELLAKRHMRQAKVTLEQVQYVGEDDRRQEIEPLVRLALADLTFYQAGTLSLIDARGLYLDFVTLYGSHRLAPYAQLQAGVCSLKQVNHPSKDQSQTLEAVSDLEVVTNRYPGSPYSSAASQSVGQARDNLAEHEYLVGRFYLKRKKYGAATERLRSLLERYPEYGEKEKVYYHLAQAHLRNKNDAEARKYLDKLLADYPAGRFVEPARKALDAVAASPAGKLQVTPGTAP